ncbi:golgin subfamily A member 6-like protein 22 isoform X2 [Bactrocera neohumeralis]|uniref:golgin subfamily A member 6-like protein 22 isoform X2 n=1 Tax=Bactrocera neohumeralis TaxID=98809 RepID=UPI002166B0CB|nr:golgin subfamily A member 6-like protein 22 isoform X2 [Bactrocera neohumeralis]
MGDELLPELGDLVFSVLIGYAGALEFLYVVRHLYHWSCGHMNTTQNDAESLQRLQQRMRNELTAAESKERQVGTEVMKDGVLYKDGFRIDAEQLERDRLKAAQSTPEAREKRKKEIELELRRQKEIEDETRKQLAEAEAKLAEQRAAAEELEAQQRAEEERKLLEAERVREEQQKREEEQKEAAEEARKLLEIERLREEEERRREVEENERKEREAAEAKKAEEQRRRQQEEEARIAAEEEELRRQEEAESARKAVEEERLKRQEEEIAAARIAAEEEELRRQEEEETARLRAEEEALRRQEAETARLAVEEETRQHLEAESAAAEQKRAEEEEDLERQAVEIEEQTIKLIEAERQRELEQLRKEMEDSERATQKEIDEEAETIENERKLLEAERLREAEQRNQELEEWESKINTEDHMEDSVYKNEVYASSNPKKTDEAETLDSIMQLLDAESERNLREKEFEERAAQERLERQKIIEENARKFLEADHEMEELLETVQKQRRLSATESAPQSPVFEEPCVKKTMSPLSDNSDSGGERLTQTVKTQFGQTSNEPYSLTTKPLLFKSISDDTPSFEPQSSLSVQPSEEYDIDRDGTTTEHKIDVQFAQLERQEPEGGEENDTATSTQYTEDYLRSLDGIKQRPLVREDGSGRRRAFKKRRSSGSSNSSFDSRASREEEVKMFTSLEEEELQPKKEGDTDFTPITYASEPLLKVKMPRRRHKRSPAKDAKPSDNNVRGSLEMLDEEANTNPWGEVTPEHYKDMPFWKREKSMSIDEEAIELEPPAKKTETEKDNNARNVPQTAAFEEATHTQNEEAITAIKRQQTKEEQDNAAHKPDSVEPTRSDIQSNLIFSGEYTKAMDKDWHSGHFCCWQCDESLTGQRYVIRDDHPYCIKCYENVFANTCEECNKIIGIDSKDLSYKDKHWHEACFLCFKCHLSLVDKQFGAKADKIYCGTCYDAQFASRCDGCGEVFRAGTKKMEYKTRQWHENCFCCCVCKTAIGTKSFIPREQEIYCAGCYEEKFATRCIKCNKVITSGGVTYKNEPWHRECFTCTHCNITLAGQRFTSRDEKPYCAECFGELFAKRCTACEKPITGIGGTRFISFEDRHWHHDCFVCASCKTSLVGRGFITDGPDIICPECAKQRLM